MFINNPDPSLLPSYRISPFKTDSISFNHNLIEDNFVEEYFENRFGKGNYSITINGRESIKIALKQYNLMPNDVVTILTTTQNFYISSCVTKEIENFCQWDRKITPKTKVIFVNHEFGFPYQNMEKLLVLGIPIIEDCCTTFFSQDDNQKVGRYGDFSIYSFPKFFPIQIGGLIVKNNKDAYLDNSKINEIEIRYVKNVLSHYLKTEKELLTNRLVNFDYMLSQFLKYGFTERIKKNDNIYPTSFLFNNNNIIKDLPRLKEYLYMQGIQCSVFYGEDAFFVPCHQNMNRIDIDYILNCILHFKNKNEFL